MCWLQEDWEQLILKKFILSCQSSSNYLDRTQNSKPVKIRWYTIDLYIQISLLNSGSVNSEILLIQALLIQKSC